MSCLYAGGSKSSQKCRLVFKWVVIWQHCCRIRCLLPLYACVGSSCTLELVCHMLELLKWRWVPGVIASVSVLANSSCARWGRVLHRQCGTWKLFMGIMLLKKMAVCVWYSNFKSGQEFLENEPCSGRTWTVNAERISKGLMCQPADNHQRGFEWSGYLIWISTGNSDNAALSGRKTNHTCQNHHNHHTLHPVTFGSSLD